MTYLDTGCFVKLYYPEADSARVIAAIQNKLLCYTALHEIEFVNALHLKVFLKSATAQQVTSARALVEADLKSGALSSIGNGNWIDIFSEAVGLAEKYTGAFGCRSLDILHCAAAQVLQVSEFISTDGRQTKLAAAIGLNLVAI